MATEVKSEAWKTITALALLIAAIGGVAFLWLQYQDRYEPTPPDDPAQGSARSQVITATMKARRDLRVGTLSGLVQAKSEDSRWGGWLKSGQVAKMPYSVDYFVELSKIRKSDLQWDDATGTLLVDAPDVTVSRSNIDEGKAQIVERTGVLVTREASEQLSKKMSGEATRVANQKANSPERMAQAREAARRAIAETMKAPLIPLGFEDARVVVTFPAERGRSREDWDRSNSPKQATEARARS